MVQLNHKSKVATDLVERATDIVKRARYQATDLELAPDGATTSNSLLTPPSGADESWHD